MSKPRVPLDLHHAADIARQLGNPDLIRYLSRAIRDVERQPCKFRCRTGRSAFKAGAQWAQGYATEHGEYPRAERSDEAYREWRDE